MKCRIICNTNDLPCDLFFTVHFANSKMYMPWAVRLCFYTNTSNDQLEWSKRNIFASVMRVQRVKPSQKNVQERIGISSTERGRDRVRHWIFCVRIERQTMDWTFGSCRNKTIETWKFEYNANVEHKTKNRKFNLISYASWNIWNVDENKFPC